MFPLDMLFSKRSYMIADKERWSAIACLLICLFESDDAFVHVINLGTYF